MYGPERLASFYFGKSTEEASSCQEFWVFTPDGRNDLDTKDPNMTRSDIIARRRRFSIRGYKTLTDVGLDGDYVAPIQKISNNETGPLLVAYHWLDWPSAIKHRDTLKETGYLPHIPFNIVLDYALDIAGMKR